MILTDRWKEKLDAVATDAVVAREEGRMSNGSDCTLEIVAGLYADDDLHDVAGVAPHHRVMRVIDEVVLDRHRDPTGWLVSEAVFLTQDPGDRARAQIDIAVATREAARFTNRGTRVKTPGRNPADDRDLATAGRVATGRLTAEGSGPAWRYASVEAGRGAGRTVIARPGGHGCFVGLALHRDRAAGALGEQHRAFDLALTRSRPLSIPALTCHNRRRIS